MLTVIQNDEQKAIDYTLENYLVPTAEEAMVVMKKILFSGDMRRGTDTEWHGKSVMDYLVYTRLYPGIFENGHIELTDENDKILGKVDLKTTYAGSDTIRGSINYNESYRYVFNSKLIARVVVDFPTHSCNGAIKKITLYSGPSYTGVRTKGDTRIEIEKNIYSGIKNVQMVNNDNGELYLFCSESFAYNVTQNKKYEILKGLSLGRITFFNDNFYTTSISKNNNNMNLQFNKLIFNDDIISIDTENTLITDLAGLRSTDGEFYFCRNFNNKTYIVVTSECYLYIYMNF